jgi:UDP-N-acetyl-D-mannosaminuronate dehydrogenase
LGKPGKPLAVSNYKGRLLARLTSGGAHAAVVGLGYVGLPLAALDIIEILQAKGACVRYHDPYVPSLASEDIALESLSDLPAAVAENDCVVIAADHSSYDWGMVRRTSRLLIDTRRPPQLH